MVYPVKQRGKMKSFRDSSEKIRHLLGAAKPFIQAPMAGVDTPEMAAQVAKSGGVGSLACAMLTPPQIIDAYAYIRQHTDKPFNLNFFCHHQPEKSDVQQERWKARLSGYYKEFGLDPGSVAPSTARAPFDETFCALVEELRPGIVSFHFGLPEERLLRRIKDAGNIVLSSATTAEEAIWLERRGCDVIIAQGAEAGGHRGMFLSDDVSVQQNTDDLLAQVLHVVSVPVVAAGGLADTADIRRVLDAGAAAVQVGTAFLFCKEARVAPLHRDMLKTDHPTVLTNVFSGRPARGIVNRFIEEVGPISPDAPAFPYAADLVNPLRQASEKSGSADFMQMWSGAVRKPHQMSAAELTASLCAEL